MLLYFRDKQYPVYITTTFQFEMYFIHFLHGLDPNIFQDPF